MYKINNDKLNGESSDHAQTCSGSQNFPNKLTNRSAGFIIRVKNQSELKDL